MILPISIVIPISHNQSELNVWVQKRESTDNLNGLLEFPGGKIEKNESPEEAGVREVLEETGVKIEAQKLQKFKNYDFSVADKKILLMVFLYEDLEGNFPDSGRIPLRELLNRTCEIPPNNKQILLDLSQYFR